MQATVEINFDCLQEGKQKKKNRNEKMMKAIPEIEQGLLKGNIDAEGCAICFISKDKMKIHDWRTAPNPCIS